MTGRRRWSTACLVLIGVVLVSPGCARRSTGPWDWASLKEMPDVEWVNTTDQVRSLYYAGEPYQGISTRVFA